MYEQSLNLPWRVNKLGKACHLVLCQKYMCNCDLSLRLYTVLKTRHGESMGLGEVCHLVASVKGTHVFDLSTRIFTLACHISDSRGILRRPR